MTGQHHSPEHIEALGFQISWVLTMLSARLTSDDPRKATLENLAEAIGGALESPLDAPQAMGQALPQGDPVLHQ